MSTEKISKETIVRTIVLAVTILNEILLRAGKNPLPFSDSTVYEAASLIVFIAASIWAWWKNNSFTSAAIKADKYMDELRKEKKADVEG